MTIRNGAHVAMDEAQLAHPPQPAARRGSSSDHGEEPSLQGGPSVEPRLTFENLQIRLLQDVLRILNIASAQSEGPCKARGVKRFELLFHFGSIDHGRSCLGRISDAVI